MQIEVIESIERLLSHKTEWDSILKEMDSDNVFLELDWIMLWWKHFCDRHKLFVLMVAEDQEIVGFCPLMVRKHGVYEEICFIGGRQSAKMDFVLSDRCREKALVYILDFIRKLDGRNIFKIGSIACQSLNYRLLEEYFKTNKVSVVSSESTHYFINTNGVDFNTYFKKRFGNKTRQIINRKEKKLNIIGELAYKRIPHTEINEVFEIHEKRWLRKVGNSSFSKGETKEFFKELASSNCKKFIVTVDALTLNNRIISFIYGFEYKGRSSLVRIAHDDDFHFLSPGELVWKKKIEECFHSKVRVIDFGPGYEPYKVRWTDDHEIVRTFYMPSNNLQSKLLFCFICLTGVKLINAVKKNKVINGLRKYYLGKLKFQLSKANISGKVLRIRKSINQDGLLTFIKKHIYELASKILCFKKYFISGKYLKCTETIAGTFQPKEATIDDMHLLAEAMNDVPRNIIRRFTNNHKCFVTLLDNRIIQYCWINCSNIEISGKAIDLPLADFEVYMYDTYIEKSFKNGYSHILAGIFNLLYIAGFKRCYVAFGCHIRSVENEVYAKVFNPKYKLYEARIFGSIKHSIQQVL